MELLQLSLLATLGIGLLYAGAEGLVWGASAIGRRFGVAPIIVGLTVVAFGTSLPELFVSVFTMAQGDVDMAVGNVVGSNIFNILWILGLAAIIRPLKVEEGSIRREVPFLIGSSVLLWAIGRDGSLTRPDGLLLLSVFVVFLWVCFIKNRRSPVVIHEQAATRRGWGVIAASVGVGLGLLWAGTQTLIAAAVGLGHLMGMSELVIGLTIIAAGTSLPELTTSVVAALRRQDDLSMGNVTGSNIFNVLFILGVCALLQPVMVNQSAVIRDIPLMILVSLAALPILRSGMVISRFEGIVLVLGYLTYLWWLWSRARIATA